MALPEDHEEGGGRRSLGELPEDRGLRRPGAGWATGAGGGRGGVAPIPRGHRAGGPVSVPTPADVISAFQRAGEALEAPEEPSPYPLSYVVQTTFDARPINANDWQFVGTPQQLALGADPPINTALFEFTVPEARTAVIRGFEWRLDDPLVITSALDREGGGQTFSPIAVRLQVQGNGQVTYGDIEEQEGRREAYAIANANEIIRVRIDGIVTISNLPVSTWGPLVWVLMHGNLLSQKGRETQFEPANSWPLGSSRRY